MQNYIPIIGVLCLIKIDLLKRLINSIDYNVETFVILLQGNIEFNLREINNKFIKKFVIINASFNIGVSRGWNYIIKHFPSKYWIICGDDTYFENGSLKKICNYMSSDGSLNNVYLSYYLKLNNEIVGAGFTNFILTDKIFNKIGLFDENIYPVYFEDNDYWKRIVLSGESINIIPDVFIFHGSNIGGGSETLHSVDKNYRERMNKCYLLNEKYYFEKWKTKEPLLSTDLGYSYRKPFNNNDYNINQVINHKNYYNNQYLLLNHRDNPTFNASLYINLYENCYEIFNPIYYKLLNSDLKDMSNEDAIYHFIEYGIKEKRKYKYDFPSDFNPKYYKLLNSDLKDMSDNKAKFHYVEFGISENREYKYNFPYDFNVINYKLVNKDIRYMLDEEATIHYIEFGISENRKYNIPNNFNVRFYKSYYADLKNMSDEEAIIHYIDIGINENRIGLIELD